MNPSGPVNPYLPPAARSVQNDGGLSGLVGLGYEAAVERAFQLLKSGKDHRAVVDDLVSSGLGIDEAKLQSYPVFDEAKRRLYKSQFLRRVLALMLIVSGVLIPLGLFSQGGRYLLMPVAPLIAGMLIIFRMPNPKRIHPDLLLCPGSQLVR